MMTKFNKEYQQKHNNQNLKRLNQKTSKTWMMIQKGKLNK